jgi:hypothetical protein
MKLGVTSSNKRKKRPSIPSEIIEPLSTFDRGNRQSSPQSVLENRIQRAEANLGDLPSPDIHKNAETVDSRLIQDETLKLAQEYMHETAMTRGQRQREQSRPTSPIKERVLVVPKKARIADPESYDVPRTFKEQEATENEARYFSMRQASLQGPDQSPFVEIPSNITVADFYKGVKDRPLYNQQICQYAIRRAMMVPKLPILPKSYIQRYLRAPDRDRGERPCVYANRCVSYSMSVYWSQNHEGFKDMKPYCCRELLLPDIDGMVTDALGRGISVDAVLPHQLGMCILCNLKIVTQAYNENFMDLSKDVVHIIHNFQVIVGVRGEYPIEMTLLGDKEFHGIIAPILRFWRDNYIPDRKAGISGWRERECLDFQ